jgi:hypothetical protein
MSIPLFGDLIAMVASRLRIDRVAQWLVAKQGTGCGCANRQRKLNEWDVAWRQRWNEHYSRIMALRE